MVCLLGMRVADSLPLVVTCREAPVVSKTKLYVCVCVVLQGEYIAVEKLEGIYKKATTVEQVGASVDPTLVRCAKRFHARARFLIQLAILGQALVAQTAC